MGQCVRYIHGYNWPVIKAEYWILFSVNRYSNCPIVAASWKLEPTSTIFLRMTITIYNEVEYSMIRRWCILI